MTPMNRLSTISYLQDPAVLEYLQVADTHCWRFGVPRPNLAFHPTARCALQLHLQLMYLPDVTQGEQGRWGKGALEREVQAPARGVQERWPGNVPCNRSSYGGS